MLASDLLGRVAALDAAARRGADKNIRVVDVGLRPVSSFRQVAGRAWAVRRRDDFLTVIKALEQSEPGEVEFPTNGGQPVKPSTTPSAITTGSAGPCIG